MTKQELHALVFRRFIRMPYGHLLDYCDTDGSTGIPTPEECRACIPNPMGWWTPIENGAFFGGMYLYALLQGYAQEPAVETAESIRILVKGMKLLQDVGQTEGFIARGVATDGISHYPCSSEDQVFPWILGMYAYYKSTLCTFQEDIRNRLLRELDAYWPRDPERPRVVVSECVERGRFNCRDWRAVGCMLYCYRIRAELTGSKADEEEYRLIRDGRPEGSLYSRAEIISHGFASDMVRTTALIQFWIDISFHLAMREMVSLDKEKGDLYAAGCVLNGVTALPFAEDMLRYDNASGGFSTDWHGISHMAIPFSGDRREAVSNALKECSVWQKEIVPHREMEHKILGNALFALWIALTCGQKEIEKAAAAFITAHLDDVDWDSLTLCYAFVAECDMIMAESYGG